MASSRGNRRLPRHAAEFLRYFAASAAALGVDFSIYVALTELAGWHYLVSGAAGFSAGAVTVYAMSITWIFSERRFRTIGWEFTIFLAIGIIGLALTELVLYVCTDLSDIDYRLSKVFAAGVVFLFNFGLRKLILFSKSSIWPSRQIPS